MTSNREHENAILSERYSTENHHARIRPAYGCLSVWIFAFAIFLCAALTEAQVPNARRPILVAGCAALMGIGFLLMLAPKSWLRLIGEIGGGADPIESVLGSECKVVARWVVARQVIVVCVLLPLIHLGVHFCMEGPFIAGVAILIVVAIAAMLNFRNSIFKPASDFAGRLKETLRQKGYIDGESKLAAEFLKHSFLKSDSMLQIVDFWVPHQNKAPFVGWGRYNTSGDSLGSGVFCLAEYYLLLSRVRLAETMTQFSSVHFDKETESLFGTFTRSENSSLSLLSGLPWQFVGRALVCRIDHEVLLTTNKLEQPNEDFMNQMVDCWSLLSEQLAIEAQSDDEDSWLA